MSSKRQSRVETKFSCPGRCWWLGTLMCLSAVEKIHPSTLLTPNKKHGKFNLPSWKKMVNSPGERWVGAGELDINRAMQGRTNISKSNLWARRGCRSPAWCSSFTGPSPGERATTWWPLEPRSHQARFGWALSSPKCTVWKYYFFIVAYVNNPWV